MFDIFPLAVRALTFFSAKARCISENDESCGFNPDLGLGPFCVELTVDFLRVLPESKNMRVTRIWKLAIGAGVRVRWIGRLVYVTLRAGQAGIKN